MSTNGFLIRDGLEDDIAGCLELDHQYSTDYVWQMMIDERPGHWQVTFNTQRLPRLLETVHTPQANRLRLAAAASDQCFLVAAARNDHSMLGYLTMRNDPVHSIALIQDVVVSQPFRGQRIGTRLIGVARQWAAEHQLSRFMIEVSTQNYPAIHFCQKLGFKFCGFNDHYFDNHDIAVFFSQSVR